MDALNAQSMYHSPDIRAVYSRVRQLAHLATDTADHLIDAVDILNHARDGLPIELGDDFLAVPTEHEALQEAGRRFTLVTDLTALGASDALAAAELYVSERRHRGAVAQHQPPPMSPAQEAALRGVAHGEVTIADGKPQLRRDDLRVTISTVRALEGRGLIAREDTRSGSTTSASISPRPGAATSPPPSPGRAPPA